MIVAAAATAAVVATAFVRCHNYRREGYTCLMSTYIHRSLAGEFIGCDSMLKRPICNAHISVQTVRHIARN